MSVDSSYPQTMLPTSGQLAPTSIGKLERWVWGLVALGITARLLRFLVCAPLWPDEAFLAASFIDRGYLDLVSRPLEYHQMAAPIYLWIQLTIVKLCGFHEYSLRLFSLLTGIASLFVFRHMAKRLLSGTAYLFTVGVFAVAYPIIRYSAEAKPYSFDLFVSLVLAALFVEWQASGRRNGWLWGLAVATPIAIWSSFPSVFIAGGVSLAVAWSILRDRHWAGLPAFVVFNVAMLAAFLGLQVAIAPMVEADLTGMRECWKGAFPPLGNLGQACIWLLSALTGEVTAFPIGSVRGGSSATFLCCVAAVVFLWRAKRLDIVLLCLVPLGLNLIAASIERYPFGGGVRFTLYAAGGICFLAGLGGALTAGWLAKHFEPRKLLLTSMAVLTLIAGGTMVRDFIRPYKTRDILRARSFAQWFWFDKAHDAELVCLRSDLGQDFSPVTFGGSVSSLYVCNQKIYSARHRAGKSPNLDNVSAEHPLRCAMFRAPRWSFDQQAFDAWMSDMREKYSLVSHEQYPFPVFHKDRDYRETVYVELYEFVPHGEAEEFGRIRNAFNVRTPLSRN